MSSLDAPLPDAFYYCAAPLCKRPPLPSHQLQWWGGSHNCPPGWYCLEIPRGAKACFNRCVADELANHRNLPPTPDQIHARQGPLLSEEIRRRATAEEYTP